MRDYQEGNVDALGALVKSVLPKLAALTRRRFMSSQQADDALQEALIAIMKNAKSFRGESKVMTWMYTLTSNVCIDMMRKEASRSSLNISEEPLQFVSDERQDFAENLGTQLAIRNALTKLPREQSEVIILTWLDGMSVDEASNILGIPSGTVKSRCDRGKKALAEILSELNPNRGNQGPK